MRYSQLSNHFMRRLHANEYLWAHKLDDMCVGWTRTTCSVRLHAHQWYILSLSLRSHLERILNHCPCPCTLSLVIIHIHKGLVLVLVAQSFDAWPWPFTYDLENLTSSSPDRCTAYLCVKFVKIDLELWAVGHEQPNKHCDKQTNENDRHASQQHTDRQAGKRRVWHNLLAEVTIFSSCNYNLLSFLPLQSGSTSN